MSQTITNTDDINGNSHVFALDSFDGLDGVVNDLQQSIVTLEGMEVYTDNINTDNFNFSCYILIMQESRKGPACFEFVKPTLGRHDFLFHRSVF